MSILRQQRALETFDCICHVGGVYHLGTICYQCRNVVRAKCETLAHNLAIGAALCRAFELGARYADDLWRWDERPPLWHPGCGRSAP